MALKAPTLLTVKEAAEMLRVSQNTVHRLISTGQLTAHRVGHTGIRRPIRIEKEAVMGMLEPMGPNVA